MDDVTEEGVVVVGAACNKNNAVMVVRTMSNRILEMVVNFMGTLTHQ